MEKLVAITTSTETVGVKIKDIESIYKDTEGILSIQTVNSTLHDVTEVNGIIVKMLKMSYLKSTIL